MEMTFAVLSLVAAMVSATAAWAAWRSSATANLTANRLATIEIDRRHSELIPQFAVTAKETTAGYVVLTVQLVGPPALDRVDAIALTLRDDRVDRMASLINDADREERREQIWGPYRFSRDVDQASPGGREVPSKGPLALGDSRRFQLEKTHPPLTADGAWWSAEFPPSTFKLSITCKRSEDRPWTVPLDVDVTAATQVF
jgi:hypothetical protein